MFKKHLTLIIGLLVIASMVLAACQPAATPTEAPVATEPPAAVTEAPVEPTAVPAQPTAAPAEPTAVPTEEPTPEPVKTTRHGGWLDEVVFSVVDDASAVTQIQAGAL